jgi:ABC-type nitrate/sulfonate/bicarbonate transport system permease component
MPTAILRLDGALRGVALGPGEHLVTFRYRPVPTYLGFGLAVLTAVLLGIWLLVGRRARRGAADVTPPDRASVTPS